ncbi:hypothetical protein M422DRAFT_262719 [Sphaerobolus stellatus SS14]|uniref:DUF6533 domain-containing protein n=1 Tax=Sphaerobolus stellatus (strain SS14) TaxID=990650 RepID=A0A0C9TXF8_SPHS4|nr:hypothetical protein M422DRAFT_262719 [Sphaerobolus stellatus SS14]
MNNSDITQQINAVFDLQGYAYTDAAAAALIVYDSILTLGNEIPVVWRQQFTFATFVYILIKYSTVAYLCFNFAGDILSYYLTLSVQVRAFLFSPIPFFTSKTAISFQVLNTIAWVSTALAFVTEISISFALIGRAYAVSGGKLIMAGGLGVLLAVYIALNITVIVVPMNPNSNPDIPFIFIVSLLSDTAVMVIRAYYAFAVRRRLREIFANDAQSLVVIFFRQGVIRFVILFLWSLEISISEKTINPSLAGIDNDLKTAVSAILIYRFLLELRRFNEKTQNTGDSVTPVTLTSLRARIGGLNDTFINEFGSEMNPEAEHVPEDGTN